MRNSAVNADASVARYSLISGLFLCVIISSWMEENIRAWPASLREHTAAQSISARGRLLRHKSPWDAWMYVGGSWREEWHRVLVLGVESEFRGTPLIMNFTRFTRFICKSFMFAALINKIFKASFTNKQKTSVVIKDTAKLHLKRQYVIYYR